MSPAPEPETSGAAGGSHRAARATAVAVAAWVLLLDAWFAGPLLGRWGPRAAAVMALACAAAVFVARRHADRDAPADRRFIRAVAALCVLATLYRLPALVAPGSVISSDSAIAGIIAQELRSGEIAPPIYAPGFPYEGTLKPHLTALLGRAMPAASTPLLYTLASHVFHLVWLAAVMVLARGAGGLAAAIAAGLYMAASPRFLTAFSLNNVGQYAEVNALGAASLALLARGRGLLLPGLLAGLAVWQQLLGIYFVLVLVLVAVFTPELRRPRSIAAGVVGLAAGSYPIWIWNAANGWATLDLFRRGGKNPADRLLGLPERLETVARVSLPRLFGFDEVGLPEGLAIALSVALPAVVLWMAWRHRASQGQPGTPGAVRPVFLLFVVVVGVFAVSKFSHRGAQRPRYLMPLYTSVAVAGGWGLARLAGRSRTAAAVAGAAVLAVNVASTVPWLRSRAHAKARDALFLEALDGGGVRTAYAGFWLAPKYTFLSGGRVVLSGELGPDVSWVHPGHAASVRAHGPDGFVLRDPSLARAFAARLDVLGVGYQRTDAPYIIFHHLSRRVTLEEVADYDATAPGPRRAAARAE